jgi:hypothetical protein
MISGSMTNTASTLLRTAERMEAVAQALYTDLAISFSDHPDLKQLFLRLAAEEEQHALRIRLLERSQGKLRWPRDVLEQFCSACDAMIAEMETLRRELGPFPASNDTAKVLGRLAALEERFGLIHAQDLARHAGPEVQELFASLALQDAAHRVLIKAAMK